MHDYRAISVNNSILSANHNGSRHDRNTDMASNFTSYLPDPHASFVSNGLGVPSVYLRNSSPNVLTDVHYRGLHPPAYYWTSEKLTYPYPYSESYYSYLSGLQSIDTKEDRAKKRRSPSLAQRRAANVRERRRMLNLNEAFDVLRRRVPTFNYERRLSRIETLRLAMGYISFMTQIINGTDPQDAIINFVKPVVSVKTDKELQENVENHE